MDVARTADGDAITIEQARNLPVVPELWCAGELEDGSECGGKAWPTSLHSTLRAAAFAAHHREGCDLGSTRSSDRPGDAGHEHLQGTRPRRWRLRIGAPSPSTGPEGRRRPDPDTAGSSTRLYDTDARLGDVDSTDERALSTLLLDLIAGTLPIGLELIIGTRDPRPAHELIVAASAATATDHAGQELLFWGRVSGHVSTQYDSLVLRLDDAADDLAILVDAAQLEQLQIPDPDVLTGRHVIAYGRYMQPEGSRRPHVRVLHGAIAFRPRYRHRAADEPS